MNTRDPPVRQRRGAARGRAPRSIAITSCSSSVEPRVAQTKPVPPLPGLRPASHAVQAVPRLSPRRSSTCERRATRSTRRRGAAAGPRPCPTTRPIGAPGVDGAARSSRTSRRSASGSSSRLELRHRATRSRHRRGKSAMSPQGWHEDYPDPSDFLEPRFATRSIGDEDGRTTPSIRIPRVDALLARAKRETDRATSGGASTRRSSGSSATTRRGRSSTRTALPGAAAVRARLPCARGWATDVVPLWLDRAAGPSRRTRRRSRGSSWVA